MMYESIREMRIVTAELVRVHELNIELLDTLSTLLKHVFKYADENGIPIKDDDALLTLINRASSLHNEITQEKMPSTDFTRRDDQSENTQNPPSLSL